MYRSYKFSNNTKMTQHIYFRIKPKEGAQMNFRVPHSAFKVYLPSKSERVILVLTKTDPSDGKPWGEYTHVLNLQQPPGAKKSGGTDTKKDAQP